MFSFTANQWCGPATPSSQAWVVPSAPARMPFRPRLAHVLGLDAMILVLSCFYFKYNYFTCPFGEACRTNPGMAALANDLGSPVYIYI